MILIDTLEDMDVHFRYIVFKKTSVFFKVDNTIPYSLVW
jgi:hypothetical protein